MGDGRINAEQACACAASTLNLPPVADFTADNTTVIAGSTVNFTDMSAYSPTAWSWSFPGGTPTSSTQQNPSILYSTPGVYNVSLTATNTNGNDTKVQNSYITVTANTGCDTIGGQDPFDIQFGAYIYSTGTNGSNGFVAGANAYGDKAKAEYINASPYTYITGCWMWLGRAYSSNPNKVVPVKVWDGTGGTPGSILKTVNLTMQDLMDDVNNNYLTYLNFSSPVTLPASKEIFIGIDLTNLDWPTSHDSLAIVTTQASMGPATGWEQWSDNTWHNYTDGWSNTWSHYIDGFFTDQPAVATLSATPTTVCEGESVNFDATGSTYDDTLAVDI